MMTEYSTEKPDDELIIMMKFLTYILCAVSLLPSDTMAQDCTVNSKKFTTLNLYTNQSQKGCFTFKVEPALDSVNSNTSVFRTNYNLYDNDSGLVYAIMFDVFKDTDSVSYIFRNQRLNTQKEGGFKFIRKFHPLLFSINKGFDTCNCYNSYATLPNKDSARYDLLFSILNPGKPYVLLNYFRSVNEDSIYYILYNVEPSDITKQNDVAAKYWSYYKDTADYENYIKNNSFRVRMLENLNEGSIALKQRLNASKDSLLNIIGFKQNQKKEWRYVTTDLKAEYIDKLNTIVRLVKVDSANFVYSNFYPSINLFFDEKGRVQSDKSNVVFSPNSDGDTTWFRNVFFRDFIREVSKQTFPTIKLTVNNENRISAFINKYSEEIANDSPKVYFPFMESGIPGDLLRYYERYNNDTLHKLELRSITAVNRRSAIIQSLRDSISFLRSYLEQYNEQAVSVPTKIENYPTIFVNSTVENIHFKAKSKNGNIEFSEQTPGIVISESMKKKFKETIYDDEGAKAYDLLLLKVFINNILVFEDIKYDKN